MRKAFILFTLLLILFPFGLAAKTRLSDSRRNSERNYIYTISASDLHKLHQPSGDFSEEMLGRKVAEYDRNGAVPVLPRGNYVIVSAEGNQLRVTDYLVDNLVIRTIPGDDFKLSVCDSAGMVVPDADVRVGKKRIRFNPALQVYQSGALQKDQLIEVRHQGVIHFLEVDIYAPKESFLWRMRRMFHQFTRKVKIKLSRLFRSEMTPDPESFVVFSKPRYRPHEKVSLKGYVSVNGGDPYDKPVDMYLVRNSYYGRQKFDTLLVRLDPYRPGMYAHDFVLNDSLGLTLDYSYSVQFREAGCPRTLVNGQFLYQDYELGGIRFGINPKRASSVAYEPVKIELTIQDENQLQVLDGSIRVDVRPQGTVARGETPDAYFMPDLLWSNTFFVDTLSERAFVLPDSIFPEGLSFDYQVSCTYLTPDNKPYFAGCSLFRDSNERSLTAYLKNSRLYADEWVRGISSPVSSEVEFFNGEYPLSRRSVMLPDSIGVPWNATRVAITTPGSKKYIRTIGELDGFSQPVRCDIRRSADSVAFRVDNPAGIPFWYLIRKGKHDFMSGYVTELDLSVPDPKKEGYLIQVSCLFGGVEFVSSAEDAYTQPNLQMDVRMDDTVTPGQVSPVLVSLKDKAGNPVAGADVTAWSYTSKFGTPTPLYGLIPGICRAPKIARNVRYPLEEDLSAYTVGLTWNKWRDEMSLDTIEYYLFLYPEQYYGIHEPSRGGKTLLSPYVVEGGENLRVELLWVDGILQYIDKAGQQNPYVFEVTPGEHELLMRTSDHYVLVKGVQVAQGQKNIFSFAIPDKQSKETKAVHSGAPEVTVTHLPKNERGTLSEEEVRILTRNLISVNYPPGRDFSLGKILRMPIPSWLQAGNRLYDVSRFSYSDFNLAGPFPERFAMNGMTNMARAYQADSLWSNFIIRGGTSYLFYPDYQLSAPFVGHEIGKRVSRKRDRVDFAEQPLEKEDIYRLTTDRFWEQMKGLTDQIPLDTASVQTDKDMCRLKLEIASQTATQQPEQPVLVLAEGVSDTTFVRLYCGGVRSFFGLPKGEVRFTLFFRDKSFVTKSVDLRRNGTNNIRMDESRRSRPNEWSEAIFSLLNGLIETNPVVNPFLATDSVRVHRAQKDLSGIGLSGYVAGTVVDETGEPIPGVSISLVGTDKGCVTDMNGAFQLPVEFIGSIKVSYVGYETEQKRVESGKTYKIRLRPSGNSLDEVMVVGYGTRAVPESDALVTRQAGLKVRGTASAVFEEEIMPAPVEKEESLSDKQDAKLSGSVAEPAPVNGGIRRDFRDDAFWQPRLTTDAQGIVKFDVTYPGDLTSWDAYFVAVAGKKRFNNKQVTVRSMLDCSARLSMPRFMLTGDSAVAVGRVVNYTTDTLHLIATATADGHSVSTPVDVWKTHLDRIPFVAQGGDSVSVRYAIGTTGQIRDGEERSIPVYAAGLSVSQGEFRLLNGDETCRMQLPGEPSAATLYAHAAPLRVMIDEAERIMAYPFDCNEQMASKIYAMLLLGQTQPQKYDRKQAQRTISALSGKLLKNRNAEGMWGWWNISGSDIWITRHVIGAFVAAEKAGYTIGWSSKKETAAQLRAFFEKSPGIAQAAWTPKNRYSQGQMADMLACLRLLDAEMDYDYYFDQLSLGFTETGLYDRIRMLQLKALLGKANDADGAYLLKVASKTLTGSRFWEEKRSRKEVQPCFERPFSSRLQLTAAAYEVLRSVNAPEEVLSSVRNYLFESRRNGFWLNTYDASCMFGILLPDIAPDSADVTLYVDGKAVSQFPYTTTIGAGAPVEVRKTGTGPVFVSLFRETHITDPVAEQAKGYAVRTRFLQDEKPVSVLTEGTPVVLEVTVVCAEDAAYTQLEVPVPAGCSYGDQPRVWRAKESHREFFRDKTVIFCDALSKGEHTFRIELIPRFSGRFTLNPAKAELMYAPVFYGNESRKTVVIGRD